MMPVLVKRILTGLLLITILSVTYLWLPPFILSVLLFGALGFIFFVEWPRVGIAALTLWYPVLPFALLIILNQMSTYRFLVPLIFALAMVFDVGAYIVGSLVGKHKIAPFISPQKSWEGLMGGITASLLLACIPPLSIIAARHPINVILLIIFVDLFAFAGDLYVSLLKRRACIKDCSQALPGHGGLLDRFDSILFVTLVIFVLRKYLL